MKTGELYSFSTSLQRKNDAFNTFYKINFTLIVLKKVKSLDFYNAVAI